MNKQDLIQYLKDNFFTKKGSINPNKTNKDKRDENIIREILCQTSELKTENIVERIYYLINGNSVCLYCDEKPKFRNYNLGYSKICSSQYCISKMCSERAKGKKQSKETIEKRFKNITGSKRPEHSRKMKEYYSDLIRSRDARKKISDNSLSHWNDPKYRKKISDSMKQKISSGEFTPNINNRWTRWNINIDGKKFRSSFEGIFHLHNPDFLYEKIRVPYIGTDNMNHNYILDFVDEKTKTIYEIKPRSLKNDDLVKIKERAAVEWSIKNNFKFKFIFENDIFNMALSMKGKHKFVDEFLIKYERQIQKTIKI